MRTLNRLAIATGIILSSSVLYASSAMAQATDTVDLAGSVITTLDVAATATTEAGALPLQGATDGEIKVIKVADVIVTTNNSAGLNLAVTDGNITSTGGTTSIAYLSQTVDNGAAAPAGGSFAASFDRDYATGFDAVTGQLPVDLYIRYAAPGRVDPGAYTGQITLTVTDL